MIPPCDPSILEHNPQFKRLYENLTTTLLNPDGSTRATSKDPVRAAAVEELKQCQIRRAKKQIQQQTLRRLAFASDSELLDDFHDNLALISLYLETPSSALDQDQPLDQSQSLGHLHDNALSLLQPEFETFCSNIPSFITQFSNILSKASHDLRAIASTNPDNNDLRRKHARPLALPLPFNTQCPRPRKRSARSHINGACAPPLLHIERPPDVIAAQAQVLERTVLLLERAKHGALARATKAKAEHLATVAQGWKGNLTALSRYQRHLRETKARLDERRESAIEELKRYGDIEATRAGGAERVEGGTLAEIARRYGLLVREVDSVRMEIARLGE
ncbi:hypothetical protein N7470_005701 [Penicillium chermesinum]|nr:hypothetical protein N7470_005701 [Penicillium chermesinum]